MLYAGTRGSIWCRNQRRNCPKDKGPPCPSSGRRRIAPSRTGPLDSRFKRFSSKSRLASDKCDNLLSTSPFIDIRLVITADNRGRGAIYHRGLALFELNRVGRLPRDMSAI